MLKKSIVINLLTLILNIEGGNIIVNQLPNPLPDSCMLIGADPPTACTGACPPCWIVNQKGQIDCYDYKPGTKQCPGWEGIEDVSQKLIDRAKQNGYYNSTTLPATLSPTATGKASGTQTPGSSDSTKVHGTSLLVLAAGLLITSNFH